MYVVEQSHFLAIMCTCRRSD